MPKIAIYSGDIPSTTFIERLINGLANEENKVFLFGLQKRKVNYPPGVKVVSYSSNLSKGWQLIKYYLLLFFSRPGDLNKLIALCKLKYKNHYWHKLSIYLPVLYYKPDIFHIQWAKAVDDWVWVSDFDIKTVVSLRGTHINYSPISIPGLADMYRNSFPKVDGFHAVSDAIYVKGLMYGAHNMKTIYSGLVIDDFRFQPKKVDEGKIKILSIGRWHWVKGYNYAVDAMKILKDRGVDFQYTIIGVKASEEGLFDVTDLGLQDNILFIDHLPQAELEKYMREADILLLPSVEEGIANVVLEAMAYGTMVITTDCGGMTEAIVDNENGFVVPIRSSMAMADKIVAVSSLNETQKNKIRVKARQTVEEKFVAGIMISEMNRLYQSVLS